MGLLVNASKMKNALDKHSNDLNSEELELKETFRKFMKDIEKYSTLIIDTEITDIDNLKEYYKNLKKKMKKSKEFLENNIYSYSGETKWKQNGKNILIEIGNKLVDKNYKLWGKYEDDMFIYTMGTYPEERDEDLYELLKKSFEIVYFFFEETDTTLKTINKNWKTFNELDKDYKAATAPIGKKMIYALATGFTLGMFNQTEKGNELINEVSNKGNELINQVSNKVISGVKMMDTRIINETEFLVRQTDSLYKKLPDKYKEEITDKGQGKVVPKDKIEEEIFETIKKGNPNEITLENLEESFLSSDAAELWNGDFDIENAVQDSIKNNPNFLFQPGIPSFLTEDFIKSIDNDFVQTLNQKIIFGEIYFTENDPYYNLVEEEISKYRILFKYKEPI